MEGVNVLRETVIASIHHRGGRRVFSKPLTLGLHAPAALRRPGLDRTHKHTPRTTSFYWQFPQTANNLDNTPRIHHNGEALHFSRPRTQYLLPQSLPTHMYIHIQELMCMHWNAFNVLFWHFTGAYFTLDGDVVNLCSRATKHKKSPPSTLKLESRLFITNST